MIKKLNIKDLSVMTGLNKRTIQFYIAERLIDPPITKGIKAYYGEVHYYKLMLIKELRKTHIKLQSIKEELDRMSYEEMKEIVNKRTAKQRENSIKSFTSNIIREKTIGEIYHEPSNISFVSNKIVLPFESKKLENVEEDNSLLSSQKKVFFADFDAEQTINYTQKSENKEIKEDTTENNLDTSAWFKLSVNPDFEINIRAGYFKKHEDALNKIINELTKIFPKEDLC